ncbi:MAG: energy transducer TonB [Syntrophaceae bacterium]|nr:energy transducer TonB [Syntrophaceae bacterium]
MPDNIIELKSQDLTVQGFSSNVRFLVFDKNVGELIHQIKIVKSVFVRNKIVDLSLFAPGVTSGRQVEINKKWELIDLDNSTVPFRTKPVEGQNEMVYIVPVVPLLPGVYCILAQPTLSEAMMDKRTKTYGWFSINMEMVLENLESSGNCIDLTYSNGFEKSMNSGGKSTPCKTINEIIEDAISEIGKLIESNKYAEADKKISDLQNHHPNWQNFVCEASKRSIWTWQVLVDQKLERVENIINQNTFTLEGVVTDKTEIEGSGCFWGFSLRADDGNEYVFGCNSGSLIYFRTENTDIGPFEGYKLLKDKYERIKVYVPVAQKEYVTTSCKNQSCNGICPSAIVMYLSKRRRATPLNFDKKLVVYNLDKPIGSAVLKPGTCLYNDPELNNSPKDNPQLPPLISITGFVRKAGDSVVALQTNDSVHTGIYYAKVEDISDFKKNDENGAYLEIILSSSVFNKNGKVGAKETMKQIDTYLSSHPQSRFAADALLDYLLCLDWLFFNEEKVNNNAILQLAEIYTEKARQRFPGTPQTGMCDTVLLNLQSIMNGEEISKKLDQQFKTNQKDKEKPTPIKIDPPTPSGSKQQSSSKPTEANTEQLTLARRQYYTSIWNAVRQHWALPEGLKRQKLEAVFILVLRRDGKIMDLRIEKKSGNPDFDRAAEMAIRQAEPLPPFPEIYTAPQEDIALRFTPESI